LDDASNIFWGENEENPKLWGWRVKTPLQKGTTLHPAAFTTTILVRTLFCCRIIKEFQRVGEPSVGMNK